MGHRKVLVLLAATAVLAPGPTLAVGAPSWTRQFGTGGLDEAKAVAVNRTGHTFVVGETFGTLPGQKSSGSIDAFLRVYDAAGEEVWSRQFGTWERDIAWAVGIDPAGDAYVAGETWATLSGQASGGGRDAFVRKYDPRGNELWTRQFGGGGGEAAVGVAFDSARNSYVVGTTRAALPGQAWAGDFDAFVRKYDPDGNELWTRQFGSDVGDGARGVTVDGAGQVLVVGTTEGTLSGQASAGGFDAFMRKYDADGVELWTRVFGSPANDYAVGVAVDGDGEATMVGSTDASLPGQVSEGGSDAFVRRFDVTGTVMWTHQFGTGVDDDAWGVAVDRGSDLYLVGSTDRILRGQRSAGGRDAYVQKYDRFGTLRWTHQFGTPETDSALGVALDPGSAVLVVGATRGALAGPPIGDLDAYTKRLPLPPT